MQSSNDSIWIAIAERWLAASLGEITPAQALDDVVRAIDVLTGTPCVVEGDPGVAPAPVASERAAAAILDGAPRVEVDLVSGEGQPLGRLSLFAPPPSLQVVRLGAAVSLVVGQRQLEARRQMILHEINNRIAALLANVDFVEVLLEGATAEVPPLRNATPEQRREFLSAIGNVGETARSLAQLARKKRASPP